MKFKDVAISDASTEAKVAALAVLLDKELLKLAETVLKVEKIEGPKGEQGLQGPKGEQGDRGFDGTNGKDGTNGADGRDGEDGKQGVGVQDAHIDFDGSLIITLTDGREINAGEVVPMDVAEKIKIIGNGGGTSQSVLDAIAALQATIATYGTMATQNANNVAITGGTINGTTVGATTAAAGTFTTLNANGLTTLKNTSGTNIAVLDDGVTSDRYSFLRDTGGGAFLRFNSGVAGLRSAGATGISFQTNNGTTQAIVAHTASAVNYVQVTGAATATRPAISAQGSDANVGLTYNAKGSANHFFQTGGLNSFSITNAASQVNWLQASPSATGIGLQFSAQGSDTNISQVFQSKGTGAIDLAAGSSGVNISNGGTVTAITATNSANVTGYTNIPTITIPAPTTAGGVQAVIVVATMTVAGGSPTIVGGGTGYTVGDVLTVTGGTFSTQTTMTVTTVSAGVITGLNYTIYGVYSVLPSNPVSVTGGTGSGATFTVFYRPNTYTISNAGSGYVEQPSLTFSAPSGGPTQTAYATVGSGTVVRSLGTNLDFVTPVGFSQLRVSDSGSTTNDYVQISGGASPYIASGGASSNSSFYVSSRGTGSVVFRTNGVNQTQLLVSHTASAVNYVQVTGAATGSAPSMTAQGSDTSVNLRFQSKSTGSFFFTTGSGTQFIITHSAGTIANQATVTGSTTGNSPSFGVFGTDTNIDLTLTPKGTGNVRFGTFTSNADTAITGYITIKDSSGTVRKLAVIA
jgi:hypothetical protein